MLICLRYLSYCLCVSIYLIRINRVRIFQFLNVRTFSSAVNSVGLASTTHNILLFGILYITLPVLLAVSL